MVSIKSVVLIFMTFYLFYMFFGIPVQYVFRVKNVKEAGKRNAGLFFTEDKLRKDLRQQYPYHIVNKKSVGWFPFYAGGLHGSVSILYSSFTEFLILYHVEMETSGSTGRHFMNISSTVLQGQMSYLQDAADLQRPIKINPGEDYVLRTGTSAVVKLTEGTTLLVYGRGFLPLTMGYWISDLLFVNHDPLLAISTILLFFKACVLSNGSVLHWFGEIFARLWKATSFIFDYLLILPQTLGNVFQNIKSRVNGAFED